MACSVCWRPAAPARPRVSSRNRSSSSPAISAGRSAPTRAAASSIASGIPSSRRQISPTAATFAGAQREVTARGGGPLARTGPPPRCRAAAATSASGRRQRQRPQPEHLLPAPRPAAAGWSPGSAPPGSPAGCPRPAPRPRPQVLAVIQHQQQRRCGSARTPPRCPPWTGPAATAPAAQPRPACAIDSPSLGRGQLAQPRPIGEGRKLVGRGLHRQPGLADPARPGHRHQRRPRHRRGQPGQLGRAAHERAQLHRQVPRERRQRPQRRELRRAAPARSAGRSAPAGPDPATGAHPGPPARNRPAGPRAPAARSSPTPAPARHARPPSAARTGSAAGSGSAPRPAPPHRSTAPSAPPAARSPPPTPRRPAPAARPAPRGPPPGPRRTPRPSRRPWWRTPSPPCDSIAPRTIASCRASAVPHLFRVRLPPPRRPLQVGKQERHRSLRQPHHRPPSSRRKRPGPHVIRKEVPVARPRTRLTGSSRA